MASHLKVVACLLVVLMVVGSKPATGTLTCGQVAQSLAQCVMYLRTSGQGSVPPACCNGVRNLNNAARTTPDRQAACRCLKAASQSASFNVKTASGLPGKCGVNIPYKISPTIDCNTVR